MRPFRGGREAFLSVVDRGKPHVYRRRGTWCVYLPPSGVHLGRAFDLGPSISEHRRQAGLQK